MEILPIGESKIKFDTIKYRRRKINDIIDLIDTLFEIPTYPLKITSDDGIEYTLVSIEKEDGSYAPSLLYKDVIVELDKPAIMKVQDKCGRRSWNYVDIFRPDLKKGPSKGLQGVNDMLNVISNQLKSYNE